MQERKNAKKKKKINGYLKINTKALVLRHLGRKKVKLMSAKRIFEGRRRGTDRQKGGLQKNVKKKYAIFEKKIRKETLGLIHLTVL